MTYIYSDNDRHPVSKTFTTLHYTCRHFTSSHLNFTQLHFTTLSFGLNPFKFPTPPLHLTSFHFTCTFRRFSPHFYSFQFTPFIIAFLNLFLKILALHYLCDKMLQATQGHNKDITFSGIPENGDSRHELLRYQISRPTFFSRGDQIKKENCRVIQSENFFVDLMFFRPCIIVQNYFINQL